MSGKLVRTLVTAALLAMFAATTAMAAEHEASPNPLAGDFGNALWTLVIFVIVLVLLSKFAWKPILGALKSREEFIAKSLRDAESANAKAQTVLADYEKKMDQARSEAAAIVEEGRRDADVLKRSLQEEARKEADAIIARARREVSVAKDAAKRELFDLAGSLATGLAGQILGREVKESDHQRLIREAIDEVAPANRS